MMLKVFRVGAIALIVATLLLPESAMAAKELPRVPPTEQLVLRTIQAEVRAEQVKRTVTKLVSFTTRHTLSETQSDRRGIGASRRWIKSEFEQISAQGGTLSIKY